MRQIFTLIIVGIAYFSSLSQDLDVNNNLIELGKIYKNFMFRANPTSETEKKLESLKSVDLRTTVEFLSQTIKQQNNLTDEKYLKLPDTISLKYIFIVEMVSQNLIEENPKDNKKLIADTINSKISYLKLIDNYYTMLFNGIGNKNQPFDLSGVNFELDKYNLSNDTEKGIFFLKAMNLCGTVIWGYMNIPNPPNYKAALDMINKYPKFNGLPYYQFTDLNFEDFNIEILKNKGEMSYKEYYLDKYLSTLVYHLICLDQKKKYKQQKMDLMLSSILKEELYYKYSKNFKQQLEALFKSVK
ncbi:MAG: hypothetical protein H6607_12390 [Flavobacteriales bacterium]|nr:hypothetical protein [Flavobacteriales bacterium]